ncbi:Putative bifunctional amine oxidase DDB_G0291301 OS=Dictyostelium discoideum GN=DDB_G0291301 PE=1 SV=1 [Rhizoctonia solani AG-1 IB]|nr:Putative bifunctional amine oxidase DDB_G0291301 OS=Dictyostelium discoideum GN=DDB_G0291301 PE=1 SV=1 [Rhizoctonia solani AG-1 IB]
MSEYSFSSGRVKPLQFYHAYGEKILSEYYSKVINAPTEPGKPAVSIPEEWSKDSKPKELANTRPIKRVAIIGGGVAGLHAATLLGKHFKVDVYEANKRIGGRLFTHKFDNDSAIGTRESGGDYDYFDVGAMRFPDTEVMSKTFDLFDELGIPLIPYRMLGKKTWLAYNEIRHRRSELPSWSTDPFKVGVSKGGKVPDDYARRDPSDMLNEVIQPFIDELIRDRQAGLDLLFKYDHHSTRSYFTEKGYPQPVIDYIETMCFGTGGYDRALAETVLEELCFRYNQKNSEDLKWKCVEGGSRLIPLRMVERLQGSDYAGNVSIFTGHQVTAVKFNEVSTEGSPLLEISGLRAAHAPGGRASFEEVYSHVIFAIPPPCLRTIDLSTCRLDYSQRSALRQVSVGPSCKIGMKFKTAWWAKKGIRGGQSSTDRMARTIVYPSHGDGKSTVLIASYSWTQDATALGSLMQGRGTPEEERLKELMLADLAYVHAKDGIDIKFLREQFQDMFAWDWTHHPYSMGAFGLFGPSQFDEFYRALTRPAAEGHLHFIGETISTTHGWVAGALESAERGVYQMLKLHKMSTSKKDYCHNAVKDFKDEWSPVLGVNKVQLKLQLCISLKLQIEEFHELEEEEGEPEREREEEEGEGEGEGEGSL